MAACALGAGLAGCSASSEVVRRDLGPVPPADPVAGGWSLVLASAEAAGSGAERGRLDASLNARAGDSGYPLDRYPVLAPSLDRPRYIWLSHSAEQYLTFRSGVRGLDRR